MARFIRKGNMPLTQRRAAALRSAILHYMRLYRSYNQPFVTLTHEEVAELIWGEHGPASIAMAKHASDIQYGGLTNNIDVGGISLNVTVYVDDNHKVVASDTQILDTERVLASDKFTKLLADNTQRLANLHNTMKQLLDMPANLEMIAQSHGMPFIRQYLHSLPMILEEEGFAMPSIAKFRQVEPKDSWIPTNLKERCELLDEVITKVKLLKGTDPHPYMCQRSSTMMLDIGT